MILKAVSWLSIGLGVFFLMQIVAPLAAFYFWEKFSYTEQSLISPTEQQKNILGISTTDEGFVSQNGTQNEVHNQFLITIPSLKLTELPVDINSNNFDTNLAQLPGTAFPGERGNVFISGHSSAPIFPFGEKKETYFRNLTQMRKGDSIAITSGSSHYLYKVMGMKIVGPNDTSVINPPDSNGKYVTLMTCVPPGFNSKRLIVLSKMITD